MPLHNDELGVELDASDASSAPAEAASDASDVLDALLARAYTDARARAPQLSATQAERFEVLGELGSGGMGSVLRARDRTLDRQVALKVVRPDLAGHAELRARFLREGRILSQFNHPALCALFDFVPGPPVDLLVMELVEGATLDVAAAGDVARSTRVRWLRDLAHALVIAHGAGIIHRDLKPRNVMVTREGELKVLDFGIARSADGVATEPTETHPATRGDGVQTELGRVLGTPRYMSPEQSVGGVVTAAADVFALGRILTEVVAPRRGQPRDRALVRLAERAAARDPRERPSAADVERALTRWLEAPRRWTVRMVAAGVVLAFAGLAFRYVHDLGAERDLVLARQVQGERLIEFVVGDVAGRLEEVGPPELVTALDEQALAYFLAVDEEELSDEELRQRVEATFGVAERIRQHGRLEDARKVLDQVAGFLGQQEDLTSTEPAWLFLKGLLAFYVGQLERDAGNDVAAHAEWTRYAAIAERLAQLEPERMLHRDELAYARTNLGVLALERALSFRDDSLVEAERLFDEALDHWKARAAANPAQENLALEVADVRAWQLELAATHGDFAEAVDLARRVQERNLALLAEDRANRQLAHRAALGGLGLGKALVLAGQLGPAREALAAGLAQAELLVELDGTRTDWERTLALCHAGMTTIELEAGQPARALEHAERAFGFVEGLLATDPGNMDWRSLHGPLAVQLAEVRALRGDVAGARRALEARGGDPAGVRADDRQLGVLVEVALEHWEAPERAEGALRTALKGVRAADVRWQGERTGAALLGAMGAEVDAWRTEVCLFYRGNAGGGDG